MNNKDSNYKLLPQSNKTNYLKAIIIKIRRKTWNSQLLAVNIVIASNLFFNEYAADLIWSNSYYNNNCLFKNDKISGNRIDKLK